MGRGRGAFTIQRFQTGQADRRSKVAHRTGFEIWLREYRNGIIKNDSPVALVVVGVVKKSGDTVEVVPHCIRVTGVKK
jgi:hypothetical protein